MTWLTLTGLTLRKGLARSASAIALVPRPRRRPVPIDPFCALEVQFALTRLTAEVERLQREQDGRFALAHHLYAALAAYDQVMDEACRLAGIDALPEGRRLRRVLAEAELRARGWEW